MVWPIYFIIIAISFPTEQIVKLICILGVWLHLKTEISYSNTNTVLKAIHHIVSAILSLLEVAFFASGITVNFPVLKVPHDV